MSKIKTIFFDFDGVILDSVNVKTDAFAKLFEAHGNEVVNKVVEYHLSNGGISRFEKIRHIYSEILNKELSDASYDQLCQEFGNLVFEKVLKANWITGAKEFILDHYDRIDLFIISGTPENEMKKIVELRGLQAYFQGVYGSPETKDSLGNSIIEKHSLKPSEIIFVGDASTDFEAAKFIGTKLVGVSTDSQNPFPPDTNLIQDIRNLTDYII